MVAVPSPSRKVSVSGVGKVRSSIRLFILDSRRLASGALLFVKVGVEA